MGKDLVDLTFFKDSDEPWGFRLAGGKDFGQPLSISQVNSVVRKDGKQLDAEWCAQSLISWSSGMILQGVKYLQSQGYLLSPPARMYCKISERLSSLLTVVMKFWREVITDQCLIGSQPILAKDRKAGNEFLGCERHSNSIVLSLSGLFQQPRC